MSTPKLSPRLVVSNADRAITFYQQALGATELTRFAEPSGRIVHAEIQIGDDVVSLTEEDGEWNLAPTTLGGSPLLLTLVVPDADMVGAAMEQAGAEVLIPIDDRYYGRREGRLRDPFGHLWIISQDGEDLDHDEIRARLAQADD